jgi:DNA-directed RNA polymerase specialized sigma24 family protein
VLGLRTGGDPERADHLLRTAVLLAGNREAGEDLLQTAVERLLLRDALVRLLVQLPARQRAVLVLRYWEQLTDAEAAAVLGSLRAR